MLFIDIECLSIISRVNAIFQKCVSPTIIAEEKNKIISLRCVTCNEIDVDRRVIIFKIMLSIAFDISGQRYTYRHVPTKH